MKGLFNNVHLKFHVVLVIEFRVELAIQGGVKKPRAIFERINGTNTQTCPFSLVSLHLPPSTTWHQSHWFAKPSTHAVSLNHDQRALNPLLVLNIRKGLEGEI